MKRLGFFSKFAEKWSTAIRYGSYGFAFAIGSYVFVKAGIPVWKEFETSFAYRDFKQYGIIGTYQHRFFDFFGKMKDLEALDRENHELNQRVAILERDFELERTRNASAEMKEITSELSDRLRDEAGNELARVLASIQYQAPTHLLPHQQYALALGYFRKQEYEQAAVIFNNLLNLQDDTSYQRGDVQLLTAITWYHLKHLKLATHYLRSVVKGANTNTSLYRTAFIWQAILAKAEGKNAEAQHLLTTALARFPHAPEAEWINTRKAGGAETRQAERKVAGRQSEREPNQAMVRHQEEQMKSKDEESHGNHHHETAAPPHEDKESQEVRKDE